MDRSPRPNPVTEVNPYAAPASVDLAEVQTQLSPPVTWTGQLEENDFLITLQTFTAAERWIYLGMLPLCLGIPTYGLLNSMREGTITPFGWLMADMGITLIWLFALAQFTPQARQSRERTKAYGRYMDGRFRQAWADEEGLMLWDSVTALRIRWTFFNQGLFFKTHSLLAFRVDASQRIGIPHRFFINAEECQRLRNFLFERFGIGGKRNGPQEKQLRKIEFQGQPLSVPDEATRWDDDVWPLENHPTWHRDIEVGAEPSMGHANRSSSVRALILLLLPIWSVVAIWLAYERFRTGDWDYLRYNFWGNSIFLLPVLVVSVLLGRVLWTQHRETEKASRWKTWIRITDAGIQTRWEDFETWNAWSELGELIVEDDRVGWVMGGFPDEVVFGKETFESEEAFSQFQAALQEGHVN